MVDPAILGAATTGGARIETIAATCTACGAAVVWSRPSAPVSCTCGRLVVSTTTSIVTVQMGVEP